jgi:hypothetical protein
MYAGRLAGLTVGLTYLCILETAYRLGLFCAKNKRMRTVFSKIFITTSPMISLQTGIVEQGNTLLHLKMVTMP